MYTSLKQFAIFSGFLGFVLFSASGKTSSVSFARGFHGGGFIHGRYVSSSGIEGTVGLEEILSLRNTSYFGQADASYTSFSRRLLLVRSWVGIRLGLPGPLHITLASGLGGGTVLASSLPYGDVYLYGRLSAGRWFFYGQGAFPMRRGIIGRKIHEVEVRNGAYKTKFWNGHQVFGYYARERRYRTFNGWRATPSVETGMGKMFWVLHYGIESSLGFWRRYAREGAFVALHVTKKLRRFLHLSLETRLEVLPVRITFGIGFQVGASESFLPFIPRIASTVGPFLTNGRILQSEQTRLLTEPVFVAKTDGEFEQLLRERRSVISIVGRLHVPSGLPLSGVLCSGYCLWDGKRVRGGFGGDGVLLGKAVSLQNDGVLWNLHIVVDRVDLWGGKWDWIGGSFRGELHAHNATLNIERTHVFGRGTFESGRVLFKDMSWDGELRIVQGSSRFDNVQVKDNTMGKGAALTLQKGGSFLARDLRVVAQRDGLRFDAANYKGALELDYVGPGRGVLMLGTWDGDVFLCVDTQKTGFYNEGNFSGALHVSGRAVVLVKNMGNMFLRGGYWENKAENSWALENGGMLSGSLDRVRSSGKGWWNLSGGILTKLTVGSLLSKGTALSNDGQIILDLQVKRGLYISRVVSVKGWAVENRGSIVGGGRDYALVFNTLRGERGFWHAGQTVPRAKNLFVKKLEVDREALYFRAPLWGMNILDVRGGQLLIGNDSLHEAHIGKADVITWGNIGEAGGLENVTLNEVVSRRPLVSSGILKDLTIKYLRGAGLSIVKGRVANVSLGNLVKNIEVLGSLIFLGDTRVSVSGIWVEGEVKTEGYIFESRGDTKFSRPVSGRYALTCHCTLLGGQVAHGIPDWALSLR